MSTINMPISNAMREITVDIKISGLRTLAVRLWLASAIFRFGAWVAGCNVVVSAEEDAQ